jgi:hypothetical protein
MAVPTPSRRKLCVTEQQEKHPREEDAMISSSIIQPVHSRLAYRLLTTPLCADSFEVCGLPELLVLEDHATGLLSAMPTVNHPR